MLYCRVLSSFLSFFPSFPQNKAIWIRLADIAQNALQWEWGNFPFKNWNGICWGLPLQLAQLIKVHFLPHLESFMWERKFEKTFFKKSHIQNPNGVLLIFKLPFPNGSYRNGVCRALWAQSISFYSICTIKGRRYCSKIVFWGLGLPHKKGTKN